jgi:hypothetical protein
MRTYIESGRINIAARIMVHGPGVQHDGSILGDELPLVGEVLARDVGSPNQNGLRQRSTCSAC